MLKRIILWLHKWLGILTGFVVFLVCLSAAVYVFHDDLKLWVYPDKYFVPEAAKQQLPMPLTKLIGLAQASLPKGEEISRVDLYPEKNRSWVFRASATHEGAFGHWNYFKYYKRVFVNPYSGDVITIEDSKTEFFQLCLQLHMNLLLGKSYGHGIVAYSTLIFTLLLASGIMLWWPKKWKGKSLKRSYRLDFAAKWKRLNYDLHNVLGFYSFLIAMLFALTGLLFSFPDVKKTYAELLNNLSSKTALQDGDALGYENVQRPHVDALDNALQHLLLKFPKAEMMSIRLRGNDSPLVDVQIRLKEGRSGIFKWYYFKRDDLSVDKVVDSETLQTGDLLAALNFDLHTGSIGGWPIKLLAFTICLFCASLPITGYILWWQKRKKKSVSRR